ncbi:MAG: hypothetical protein V3V67_10345 [Myxococcota bacterium]
MKIQDLAERALSAVLQTLVDSDEPETARLLVADAVVVREGNHFAIEPGPDERSELEALALRAEGRCDCGAVLSSRDERLVCRVCGREYRWH